MAEASSLTFADVSSFGVPDTGLSQFRTPDPSPLPIAAKDRPFQPIPLDEIYLPGYTSFFPNLDDFLYQPYTYIGGPFQGTGEIPIEKPVTTSVWYAGKDGFVSQEAVRSVNADIVAGYLVDQRIDLLEKAIIAERVSRETVDLAVERVPARMAEKQTAFNWALRRHAEQKAADEAGFIASAEGQFLLAGVATTISIVFPPVAPFIAGAYGTYVLASTIPKQVETGKVTVQDVIAQAFAVIAVAGATSAGVSAATRVPVPPGALPSVPSSAGRLAPISGSPLQASFAQATGTTLTGASALEAGLFNQSVAPALSQASRLGVSTTQLLTPTLSTFDQLIQNVRRNPVRAAGVVDVGATILDRLIKGDWEGVTNLLLGTAGLPVRILPERPLPSVQLPALRLRGSGQGGGGESMLFEGPADPASANVWPWIIGAGLLGLLIFLARKG